MTPSFPEHSLPLDEEQIHQSHQHRLCPSVGREIHALGLPSQSRARTEKPLTQHCLPGCHSVKGPAPRQEDTTSLQSTSRGCCLDLTHGHCYPNLCSALCSHTLHRLSAIISPQINCYSLAPAIKVEVSSFPTKTTILANRYLPLLQSAN